MTDLRDRIARALFLFDYGHQGADAWEASRLDGNSDRPHAYSQADAVLVAIASDLDKVRAGAVREAARYLDFVTPEGLVDRRYVLADLTVAADRLESGIHANGRERKEAR